MPKGKIAMYRDHGGYGFIKPDDGGTNIFFHITEFADDDIIVGSAVTFELAVDPKTGKTKAITVDLV